MSTPGPSALSFVWDVRQRGFLDAIGDYWRRYGDVFPVRVAGRSMLFVMHPDAVRHVLHTERRRYDKRASYDGVRAFLTGEGLVASTGELWKRQRRLMAPFFTRDGVQDYAELMLRDALRLVDRWAPLAAASTEIEMADEMTQVTASIILQSMFSTDSVASMDALRHDVEAMISFTTDRLNGLPIPMWLPTAGNRRYRVAHDRVHAALEALIRARRATEPEAWPDDLLTRLMNARDEETGQAMSETLLRDESITVFFAGHETTARTMTFAWYALATNPEVAQRLHAELDTVLGSRPPTVADLHRLPYTYQVVKEVLRMYPAAPFYARDVIEADTLAGVPVPEGTAVMLSPYYTHRHPDFWSDPDRFDPDRWTKEREAAQHSHAYHPFAAGPRVCIGNNFSLLETHLLLAVLAQRYAPEMRPGWSPTCEMRGVLGLKGGLPMRIVARG